MDGRHENYEKKKRTRKEHNNNTHTFIYKHEHIYTHFLMNYIKVKPYSILS